MRTTPVPMRAAILVVTLLLLVALLPAPASSAPTGPLQLVTKTVNGAANGDGTPIDMSDDGRYLLYSSESSGLIEGFVDRNGTGPDVFLYDSETGDTQLVSHRFGSTVESALGSTNLARLSGDGNYVALQSVASDLAEGQSGYDSNDATDTFLWNRQTGSMTTLTRISGGNGDTCSDDNAADNVNSNQLSISDDGGYVAFASTCNNLAAPFEASTDGDNDIFLYSRSAGTTVNISQSSAAVQPGDSNGPVVSGNGQFVAFYSSNTTLAGTAFGSPADSNGFDDVFRYTISNGSLFVASQAQIGNSTGNGASLGPSISDDGQRVAFVSEANNLYGGSDTNGSADVFLWALDGSAFTRRLISQANESGDPDSANGQSGGAFGAPNISGDGGSIVYGTQATNLVEIGTKSGGPPDTVVDLVHHAVTLEQVGGVPTNPQANGTDTLITRNTADNDGGDDNSFNATRHATISDDGTEVAFLSIATNLALPSGQSGPFNSFDAYLWEIGQGTRLVSATPSGQAGEDTSGNIIISADGDSLAIHSLAEDLTDDEYITNPNVRNVFVQNGPPLNDGPTLSVSDQTATEGPSGSLTPMTFTITMSEPSTAQITVDYATADVTTNFGPDYGRRDGTLTFAPGETTKTVEISVSGDDVEEETETFEFRLSDPSPPATLSPTGATAIGTILDDDGGFQSDGAGVNDTIFVTTSSNAETALALSQATFSSGATPRGPSGLPVASGALIATDGGFADALSSGSLQADRPLLLTATDDLYPSVIAELERLGVSDVTILGGTVAISQSVEDELRTLGYTVNRYQGPSRLETATATAAGRYPTATTAVLARAFPAQGGPESQAFADSLAAGALAASNGWPLILTQTEVLSTSTRNYIDTSQLETIYVVGGEAAISDSVITGIDEFAITTVRLEGPSRFETALAIAGQRGYAGEGDAGRVMLLDGTADNAWAAGFAGAAHSAINGAPVVLGAADQVPGTTRDWLAGLMGPSTPRFTVDEDNITGPVLVCAIADERCLESRVTLGLPELGQTELSTPSATRGQTLSVGVSVEESATVNVTGSCLNPTSATPVTSGTTPIEISVPGEANQGPCSVTVSIDFPNGTRHTLIEDLTVTP